MRSAYDEIDHMMCEDRERESESEQVRTLRVGDVVREAKPRGQLELKVY